MTVTPPVAAPTPTPDELVPGEPVPGEPVPGEPVPGELTPDERTRYSEFDRERGVRLARVVGLAFTAFPALGLLALAVRALLQSSAATPRAGVLALAMGACLALFLGAVGLARRRRALLAAAAIVGGIDLGVAAFEALWASVHGTDALLAASFSALTIGIGLAGVLGNARFMFAITALDCAIAAAVALALPPWLGAPAAGPGGYAIVGIVSCVFWLVAVLIYGASSLYVRTLHELGDIRRALERSKRLDELKDQFITNVNHELRNPAMALRGYVELLRLRHDALSPERRAAMLDRAARAGDDLVALLTSILDMQRLDRAAGDFTPAPVDLRGAIEAAARLIDRREANLASEAELAERELRLHVPEGLAVWGEAVRVQQIFTNLLSNAIKYSPPGTPVEVSARVLPGSAAMPRGARMAEITVRDHGLGIPPDQVPLLFNRFVRLPRDLASSVPGNGLGLFLCRSLAEAMGGAIRAESAGVPGEGSTFFVSLPLPPDHA